MWKIVTFVLYVFVCEYGVNALSFPGPRVYVVTPSARILKNDEGKPTPFYYHNWMRRMDTVPDITTTTTEIPGSKLKTPDLIFAEFESDGSKQKSIKKLLENERIQTKKSTMRPIYVPDEEENKVTRVVNYGLPVKINNYNKSTTENNKYPFISNVNHNSNLPVPMYVTVPPMIFPSTTAKTTTSALPLLNIQNIWHVIDSEKSDQYSNKWEETLFDSKNEQNAENTAPEQDPESGSDNSHGLNNHSNSYKQEYDNDDVMIDDNFALPGFTTNPGNGGENESRAIRNEQNVRFPYVNLKPFQVKVPKKPLPNSKQSNLLTSLDNFYDLKNPVRGEAQDIVPIPPPIDRYNPAQPYLPQQKYGTNLSKQINSISSPPKSTASLVPPPPPPPPSNPAGNDFPAPFTYDSFPPYASPATDYRPAPAPAPPPPPPPVSVSITPSKGVDITSDIDISDSNQSDDGLIMDTNNYYKPPSVIGNNDNSAPLMNTGYQYKPPSVLTSQFYPTPVPPSKPFQGYSYNKPSMIADTSPIVADKPDFQGYHYNKPVYSKPSVESMPPKYGSLPTYGHNSFPPDTYDHDESPPIVYEHDESPHIEEHDHRPDSHDMMSYGDLKGGDDMKDDDMGMKPPSPSSPDSYGSPPDDHGFPADFPTDFKFTPDLHDHYHDHGHDHYHIVEPTTTTTETPRVNRFSYYYLGKKLYYLPLYFSVYFIIYVGALIIKAVLRHKIVYPNSWRPNTTTATFFSKRSVDEYLSHENLHELTKKVTHAIASAAEKYMGSKNGNSNNNFS